MMTYALFLDDERDVGLAKAPDGLNWVVVRDYDEAVRLVEQTGFPAYVSFDHDLGEDSLSGLAFAKWLVERDMSQGAMPENFSFFVHSQNPVGAENIRQYLNGYLDFKKDENNGR